MHLYDSFWKLEECEYFYADKYEKNYRSCFGFLRFLSCHACMNYSQFYVWNRAKHILDVNIMIWI